MKLPELKQEAFTPGVLNVFSLGAISFTWAHFLGLISLYWLPVTIIFYVIGYGSEITRTNKIELPGTKNGWTTNNNR